LQKIYILILLLLLFLSNSSTLKAQDSLRFEVADSIKKFPHSPTRAAILSAVLPGLGQIYNKKYWKLPLIYGGLITTGYYFIKFNNLYQQYLNAYIRYNKYEDLSVLDNLPNFRKDYVDIKKALEFYKDTRRRYRDLNVLIFGGIYMLNIIDAAVDAYLFNYDISDELSLRIEPTVINNFAFNCAPGLKLSFSLR